MCSGNRATDLDQRPQMPLRHRSSRTHARVLELRRAFLVRQFFLIA
jgi:hypothetical protein